MFRVTLFFKQHTEEEEEEEEEFQAVPYRAAYMTYVQTFDVFSCHPICTVIKIIVCREVPNFRH